MISANLPPGTELICINAKPLHGDPCPLCEGHLYTLRGYTEHTDGEFSVLLFEVEAPQLIRNVFAERGFDRRRFRLPLIPKLFYEMLETQKVDIGEEIDA